MFSSRVCRILLRIKRGNDQYTAHVEHGEKMMSRTAPNETYRLERLAELNRLSVHVISGKEIDESL